MAAQRHRVPCGGEFTRCDKNALNYPKPIACAVYYYGVQVYFSFKKGKKRNYQGE